MKNSTLNACCLLCLLLQACGTLQTAGPGDDRAAQAAAGAAIEVLPLDRNLDHFVAWIPRDIAQTATVAAAVAQIEWGDAREQAGVELCNGAWLFSGEVTERVGPRPVTAPPALGGYPAWYYRVSHEPGIRGCSDTPTARLYTTIRSSLPPWALIRTAGRPETANLRHTGLRLAD